MAFAYSRPRTLEETFRLLRDAPDARLLCGGTDLLVGLRKGTVRPPMVIDLKGVHELEPAIEDGDAAVRIGAATTLTQIIDDPGLNKSFPALIEAARVVGSIQIRNRATLAGNVCNASPAADTVPPLLTIGAMLELVGPDGGRSVPLAEFLLGPGRTGLGNGEIVTAVELPQPVEPSGSAFARMTRRRGVDLATVNLSCVVTSSGRTTFAYGAVGPRAFLVVDDSGTLADPTVDDATRDALLSRMAGEATPISNVRASREYREAMLLVLSRRALETARRRLAEVMRDA